MVAAVPVDKAGRDLLAEPAEQVVVEKATRAWAVVAIAAAFVVVAAIVAVASAGKD